jgi:hypothetical protein
LVVFVTGAEVFATVVLVMTLVVVVLLVLTLLLVEADVDSTVVEVSVVGFALVVEVVRTRAGETAGAAVSLGAATVATPARPVDTITPANATSHNGAGRWRGPLGGPTCCGTLDTCDSFGPLPESGQDVMADTSLVPRRTAVPRRHGTISSCLGPSAPARLPRHDGTVARDR